MSWHLTIGTNTSRTWMRTFIRSTEVCAGTAWHQKVKSSVSVKHPRAMFLPLCHVERSATTPWASLQNLKRGVETPREGFGLHSAAGNFPDAAASEQVGRAQPLPATFQDFVQRSPPAEVTGCHSETHFWGEFPKTAFLPPALSGCFDCAPIRLEAADFLQALRST